jgi:hypothetical protein
MKLAFYFLAFLTYSRVRLRWRGRNKLPVIGWRGEPDSALGIDEEFPHQVESLAVLLLEQFVEDATYLVIATPLHGLIAAEHLLDGRSQGLGSIDDDQVLAVRRQTVVPQLRQQTLDRGGVLGGS